ncbi:MAG: bifunctional glutamate N-acetyltransferase/amino-acid acetyltransferase ArgJ [Candidatus Omnitrophota bacterium]
MKKGSVTSPAGFVASGMHCGIKKRKKRHDCSLIFSEAKSIAAGVFTTNRMKAWPVLHSMRVLGGSSHRAVLATSGNANCANGPKGLLTVREAVAEAAKCLRLSEGEILIAQTGLIGVPFPISCFKRNIPILVDRLSKNGGRDAARGIMTTDKRPKDLAYKARIGGRQVTVGAIAKGAGMIHPNMATMLCFLTTDAAITKPLLRRAIRYAADATFNRMAIDNDMSTNDCVLALANGRARNPLIQRTDRDYRLFRELVTVLCRDLAYQMIEDGEGVSHVCTLKLSGAKSPTQAEKAVRQIGTSLLFKAMLAGADPNWGRIVAAIGASGADFKQKDLYITIGGVEVLCGGKPRVLNLPKARKVLQKKSYTIEIGIGKGRGRADFIASDLTKEYVEINSAYS